MVVEQPAVLEQVQPVPAFNNEQRAVVAPQEDVSAPVAGEDVAQDSSKQQSTKSANKLDKMLCFLCVQTSHLATNCTANVGFRRYYVYISLVMDWVSKGMVAMLSSSRFCRLVGFLGR
jgi:hypothetical protein